MTELTEQLIYIVEREAFSVEPKAFLTKEEALQHVSAQDHVDCELEPSADDPNAWYAVDERYVYATIRQIELVKRG